MYSCERGVAGRLQLVGRQPAPAELQEHPAGVGGDGGGGPVVGHLESLGHQESFSATRTAS